MKMTKKEEGYFGGLALLKQFCELNKIELPEVERLNPKQRNYHLGTCAYYRPFKICIMVEKCAQLGLGGASWSWPGYCVDRTPYGVLQHELGHHVDTLKTGTVTSENLMSRLFSKLIWEASQEPPLTGYLGTDKAKVTFYLEWFAEHFRLFVTNPDLLSQLRPKCYSALLDNGLEPVTSDEWELTLRLNGAPDRIVSQAQKKILHARATA